MASYTPVNMSLNTSVSQLRRSPLTQPTCSWSKFASNVRWPTLSFSCQKQEFRKWLITNFANGSHSFTTEELNQLIVIIFEEYARQRMVEEMPLSRRYINQQTYHMNSDGSDVVP